MWARELLGAYRAQPYSLDRSEDKWHKRNMAELASVISAIWPVLLGIGGLIVLLSKYDLRLAVLEDKVRTIFDLINERNKNS